MYDMDLSALSNWQLVTFATVVVVAVAVLLTLIVPLLEKNRPRCGSMVQGMFRGNFLLLGLVLAESMFGDEGVAAIVLVLPVTIIIYNAAAVIVLAHFGENGKAHSFRNTVIEIFKNPLIIASILGTIWAAFQIPMPQFLAKPLDTLGDMASPLALMMLGGQFDFGRLRGNLKPAMFVTAMRLVIIPALTLPLAAWMGFRGPEMGAIFILMCSPTAVSSFIMADSMGCDGELAGQLIVLTTFCSAFTLFGWTALLRLLTWI